LPRKTPTSNGPVFGEQIRRSNPPIDILVNNAGAGLTGDFATANPEEMDGLLALLKGRPTMSSASIAK
jgi:short-subunit dehydrogenase